MITILLARHGQASFGHSNYDQLSALGCEQAQLLGAHYAHTQRHIDAIYTGQLTRQQDSARHFCSVYQAAGLGEHLAHEILPAFDEFNHKDVFVKSNPSFSSQAAIATEIAKAPVPKQRLAELFDEAMQRWHGGAYDTDYIESWSQFSTRAQSALADMVQRATSLASADDDCTVLVFTSGGVIAAITAHLLGQDSQTAYQINKSLVNMGVTAISVREHAPHLLSLNEYSHLFDGGERLITWR